MVSLGADPLNSREADLLCPEGFRLRGFGGLTLCHAVADQELMSEGVIQCVFLFSQQGTRPTRCFMAGLVCSNFVLSCEPLWSQHRYSWQRIAVSIVAQVTSMWLVIRAFDLVLRWMHEIFAGEPTTTKPGNTVIISKPGNKTR